MINLPEKVRSLGQYVQGSLPFSTPRPKGPKLLDPPRILIDLDDHRRASRREAMRVVKHHPIGVLTENIAQMHHLIVRSNQRAEGYGWSTWGNIIYNREPILLGFLSVRQKLAAMMDYIQTANLKTQVVSPEYLSVFERENIFDHKVGGVSLTDIERMGSRLVPEDISRIDRMTMDGKKLTLSKKDRYVRFVLVYLASLKHAQPDLDIPDNLKGLQSHATQYMDYYAEQMTDFDERIDDDLQLIWDLMGGRSFLADALAVYLPARIGITPSSAVKLAETKFVAMEPSMIIPSKFWGKGNLNKIVASGKDAYKIGSLPNDLEVYQEYNPETDAKATTLLSQYLEAHPADEELYKRSLAILDKFQGQYRAKLRKDIVTSKERRVAIEEELEGLASSMTVTRHYRDTLVFILHFDSKTHLTLELDRKGRLYGIPTDLYRDDPHIYEALTSRLLQPVIKWLDVRHPVPEAPIRVTTPILKSVSLRAKETNGDAGIQEPSLKRKARRAARPEVVETAPSVSTPTVSQRKYTVIHSRSMVRRMLPKNAPEKVVDRIMKVIKDYEFGRDHSAKTLEDADGLIQLRTGNFRVEISHNSGQVYRLVDAGDKKDIQKRVHPKALN